MPDAGDDGDRTGRDSSREALVVERHHGLVRPAAATQDDELGVRRRDAPQPLDERSLRARALDLDAGEHDARERPAAAQRAQNVMDGIPPRGGDDANNAGKRRQRALARRVHEAFRLELARQARDLHAQPALAGEREAAHVEVHRAARGVQAEETRDLDLLADLQIQPARAVEVVPHQAFERGGAVLDGEVDRLVPALGGNLGHLADDGEADALERPLDDVERLRDGEGPGSLPVGCGHPDGAVRVAGHGRAIPRAGRAATGAAGWR